MQTPISIPQMTRYVPIAPAPPAAPLVTQLTTSNSIASHISSSPIQIQIQPALSHQTKPNGGGLLSPNMTGQQRITLNTEPIIVQAVGKDGKAMVVGRREQIMLVQPSPLGMRGNDEFIKSWCTIILMKDWPNW